MITCQLFLEAARAAPQSPPINAWLELEGMPKYHVTRFQTMAPIKAHTRIWLVRLNVLVSTRPEAMVLATAVPQRAPNKLVKAAKSTACRGDNTLVETTVAM